MVALDAKDFFYASTYQSFIFQRKAAEQLGFACMSIANGLQLTSFCHR